MLKWAVTRSYGTLPRRESYGPSHYGTLPTRNLRRSLTMSYRFLYRDNAPRTVVLQKARSGFGFVLRGAKCEQHLMTLLFTTYYIHYFNASILLIDSCWYLSFIFCHMFYVRLLLQLETSSFSSFRFLWSQSIYSDFFSSGQSTW